MPRKVPCDPVRALYEFAVCGWGEFPLDMLRYDSCWPRREGTDVFKMFASLRNDGSRELQTIRLVGLRPPSEGRWNSFGWPVVAND